MKVYFKKSIGPYKRGITKNIPDKLAVFYMKNGIVEKVVKEEGYLTKVLKPAKAPEPVSEPAKAAEPVSEPVDEFEGLDRESLKAIADLRGVKVHHNAGVEKIKEALKNAGIS